jgi:hypothetical protein
MSESAAGSVVCDECGNVFTLESVDEGLRGLTTNVPGAAPRTLNFDSRQCAEQWFATHGMPPPPI